MVDTKAARLVISSVGQMAVNLVAWMVDSKVDLMVGNLAERLAEY